MKRWGSIFLAVTIVILCGCATTILTWQDQYDLGLRYLSEGNYEEAILAFTAAVEIDPKRAETYMGLAEVYME